MTLPIHTYEVIIAYHLRRRPRRMNYTISATNAGSAMLTAVKTSRYRQPSSIRNVIAIYITTPDAK